MNCKDCYLILGWGENSEHCLYGKLVINCRDCVDISHAMGCELCYQCVDVENCYRLFYSQSCKQCSESYCLKNCLGCCDCFGSINLVKQAVLHLQRTVFPAGVPETPRQLLADTRRDRRRRALEAADQLPYSGKRRTNTTKGSIPRTVPGDYLRNCRNAVNCYDTADTEDGAYLYDCIETRDCMDLAVAGKNQTELSYECVNYTGQHCLFVSLVWLSHDPLYCQDCFPQLP